jgi:hypothetical protein
MRHGTVFARSIAAVHRDEPVDQLARLAQSQPKNGLAGLLGRCDHRCVDPRVGGPGPISKGLV